MIFPSLCSPSTGRTKKEDDGHASQSPGKGRQLVSRNSVKSGCLVFAPGVAAVTDVARAAAAVLEVDEGVTAAKSWLLGEARFFDSSDTVQD